MTMSSMYVGSNGLVIATCTRTRLRKYSTPRLRMAAELYVELLIQHVPAVVCRGEAPPHNIAYDRVQLGLGVVFLWAKAIVQREPNEPPRLPAIPGGMRDRAELLQHLAVDLEDPISLRGSNAKITSIQRCREFDVRLLQESAQIARLLDAAEKAVVRNDHAMQQHSARLRRERLSQVRVPASRDRERGAQVRVIGRILRGERVAGHAQMIVERRSRGLQRASTLRGRR